MLACVRFAGPRAALTTALANIGVPWNLNTALGAEIPAAQRPLVFSYLAQFLLQTGMGNLLWWRAIYACKYIGNLYPARISTLQQDYLLTQAAFGCGTHSKCVVTQTDCIGP